ncbi:MAG: FAD-dependent oxidoreductase [Christensenellaceae bacterium]|jgi:NADPH-dependent glutamate synthase beta subunit-like oxidoreductase|nr:FAD-dependent oxidoreductase [Christensenellaceae bacterium]
MQKRVLVVGAGPAGLTVADVLSEHGLKVTIHEREHVAGGFLNLIPKRRFDKNKFIEPIIKRLSSRGVKIKFGIDTKLETLPNLAFDFIVAAVGTQKQREIMMTFKKPKHTMNSIDYLKSDVKARTVAVIGGGNVAVDCACEAVSRGGEVTLLYRRTEQEMRADKKEIEYAKDIGVKFEFNVSNFDRDVDILVIAIGLDSEVQDFKSDKIFVAGDAHTGAASIASAVNDARHVANEIISLCHPSNLDAR